jgi:hypothetical protein
MPISELNDSERDWLEAHLQVARTFVETFVAPQKPLTPESLEAAWSAWLPTALDDPETANTIVNATGAAFGQFLGSRPDSAGSWHPTPTEPRWRSSRSRGLPMSSFIR